MPSKALASSAEAYYRKAEEFEVHLLIKPALEHYRKAMNESNPIWKRRAAYRAATLIRNMHFHHGRSERVRSRIVSIYKSLLQELLSHHLDLELKMEIQKELAWTRLGLSAPNHFF